MPVSSSIIGHQPIIASLENDGKTDNVAHAYLLAGPPHVGKFTVAKWFSQQLLLTGVSDSDKDRTRHEIAKLIHPDLLVIDKLWIEDQMEDPETIAKYSNISQEHRRKSKSKTDTIGIDDIRGMQERLHEVRNGRYRCCLIRGMERMQDEAVNALLKILEEPPEGVVFLLTTDSLESLLPTLISRTRVLRFSRVAEKDLAGVLKGVDEEERRFLLHLAQGAPGILLRLQSDPDALRQAKITHSAATSFWHSQSILERLELLSPLHERGEEAQNLLLHLALTLREEPAQATAASGPALLALVRGMETNVSRQLLVQRFVLSVA